MLYFKVLKQNPVDGSDLWAYEKHDPDAKSAEDWVRDMQIADGKVEVTEEEYLREVAEGTEGRSTEDPSEETDSLDESEESEEGSTPSEESSDESEE